MMLEQTQISERKACRLVGLSRDVWRHPPQPDARTVHLAERIQLVAMERRRFGYRRVHDMLRGEFPGINHKRVFRLYREQGLAVRKRNKRKKYRGERTPLVAANQVNQTWSLDFVSDSLSNGRRIKCLTIADDFSHECVDIAVDLSIPGAYVTRILDQAARFRGYPLAIRTDNGPEFTGNAFMAWTHKHGIEHILIQPGKPTQNAYIESFNGKFRDECLNESWFESLAQARELIAIWRKDYSEVRPHGTIGRIPPAAFAAKQRNTKPTPNAAKDANLPTPGPLSK
jgi:putative transposase